MNCLQKSIASSVCGQELPLAVLDYIRHNDIAVLEGCDKVLSKYQEELLTTESFAEFCDVMGKPALLHIHLYVQLILVWVCKTCLESLKLHV